MRLKGKLLTIALVPILLLSSIVCIFAGLKVSSAMKEEIYSELQASVYSLRESISSPDGNNFYVDSNDILWNGNVDITDNTDTADQIKSKTGIVLTVFYGDTRYMTSVTGSDGKRVLLTKAGDTVINTVLKGGSEYSAENVDVAGSPYFAYYCPIYNDGVKEPVGMVFAGKAQATVDDEIKTIIMGMVLVTIILIVVAVVIVTIVATNISKRFGVGVDALAKVADGDLKVDVDDNVAVKKDETGDIARSVINLRDKLTVIVSDIVKKSENVNEYATTIGEQTKETANTVEQVELAVGEIAEGATSQANDTTRATENVITMGNLVEETNKNVEKLTEVSETMEESSKNASVTLKKLEDINKKAQESIDLIYEQTNTTNESAKRISEAINIIKSIAEETNLLSLNASIEAARAGEQGRGFAVVASQISKLAEQSNESAKKIEEIIRTLIAESQKSVETMDATNVIMSEQSSMVNKTAESFEEVLDGIAKSRGYANDIASNMVGLNDSRENVVDIVSDLSAIAEENAASTEETSASTTVVAQTVQEMANNAENLQNISVELAESVSVFKI